MHPQSTSRSGSRSGAAARQLTRPVSFLRLQDKSCPSPLDPGIQVERPFPHLSTCQTGIAMQSWFSRRLMCEGGKPSPLMVEIAKCFHHLIIRCHRRISCERRDGQKGKQLNETVGWKRVQLSRLVHVSSLAQFSVCRHHMCMVCLSRLDLVA